MRNILFVPSNKEKYVQKAANLKLDMLAFDLEDSILEIEYCQSIDNIRKYFGMPHSQAKVFIRIDPQYYKDQIEDTKSFGIDGYIIPKVEDAIIPQYINKVDTNLKLLLLFESVKGFFELENVIRASRRLYALGFGGEDYCLDFNCERDERNFLYPRLKILVSAKLHNLLAFDTIYPFYDDIEGFEREVKCAISMGFDGKMLIHPMQLETFEKVKTEDSDELQKIIDEFEKNVGNGNSVLKYKGRIYERNHIRKFKEILRKRGMKNV